MALDEIDGADVAAHDVDATRAVRGRTVPLSGGCVRAHHDAGAIQRSVAHDRSSSLIAWRHTSVCGCGRWRARMDRAPDNCRRSRRSPSASTRWRGVRSGHILTPDPGHNQRDDHRRHHDARRREVGRENPVANAWWYIWVCSAVALAAGCCAPGHSAHHGQPDRPTDLLPHVDQTGRRRRRRAPWSAHYGKAGPPGSPTIFSAAA